MKNTSRSSSAQFCRYATLMLFGPLVLATSVPAHAWRVDKDGVTQMKLTEAGRLGVGTSDPSTNRVAIRGTTNDASEGGLWVGGATGMSPGIYVRNDGKVGIGTDAPTVALEVVGQVKITGGSPGAGKVLVSDGNGVANWASIVDKGSSLMDALAARVRSSPSSYTAQDFVARTEAGQNLCNSGYHACNVWELRVISVLTNRNLAAWHWVVGSFPNYAPHIISLINGQNSVVCPSGNALLQWGEWKHGDIEAAGRHAVHCSGGSMGWADVARSVACCVN